MMKPPPTPGAGGAGLAVVLGAQVVAQLVRHDERGDRRAVGSLAQRDAALAPHTRAHVGDARRGAVEILARSPDARGRARARQGRGAIGAQLIEQRRALGAVNGSAPGAVSRTSVASTSRPTCSLKMPSTMLSRASMAAVGSRLGRLQRAVADQRDFDLARDRCLELRPPARCTTALYWSRPVTASTSADTASSAQKSRGNASRMSESR